MTAHISQGRTAAGRLAALALGCCTAIAQAQPGGPESVVAADEEAGPVWYSRINLFGYGVQQDLSRAQREQNVLGLPRSQYQFEFRPDFSLTLPDIELSLKPRLSFGRRETDTAGGLRRDSGHQGYINEAYLRFRLSDRLTAMYARENLQWGPAALLSASNPFNPDNGKSNPNIELPGLDYVRLVAVIGPVWTLSLIANTGAGRYGKDAASTAATRPGVPAGGEFHKTYAAKLDYTGDGHYASVIMSHREQGVSRFGGFFGWNASDAWLLYGEGSVAWAQPQPGSGLRRPPRDTRLLAGAAYTLEGGGTLSGEYFHNRAGCRLTPVIQCANTALAQPRLPLLRRRYAMLQYVDTKLRGNINLLARAIRNLDDQSWQASFNLEYELGEHWQLYLTPTVSRGRAGSEFGTLPKRAVFFGASYTF
ncbi:hypothetical protein [Janthinobacterium sp. RB2R34]|uniref:hypothetical protein n=1 Tax=Janthinobacterium sp. RB2R34 TaxID=3424193 RepID=UPI003F242A39